MDTDTYDFAVIGSGFGGSIMAMVLRRLGKSVLLVERGSHPRFAIGESSTPFANLLLERLAAAFDLPFLRHLSEWGLWQDHCPEIPVGLKRGFTFYHHQFGERFDFTDRQAQLLVAASPNDRVADTHWYRPDFDAFLVKQAIAVGVDYSDHTSISKLKQTSNGWTFDLARSNDVHTVKSRFLLDATGPSGYLQQQLGICAEIPFGMPPTRGIFAHFKNVSRLDSIVPELRDPCLPYPPDDAAVHHVFPGGWIWVLRFNNGLTSAGAAYTAAAQLDHLANAEAVWDELLNRLPTVFETFRSATRTTHFYSSPQLSFHRTSAAGENWALLPSSAGFVDPLLSSGFALTLLGILRLGSAFQKKSPSLKSYVAETNLDLQTTSRLVSALYQKMRYPGEFSLLTMLYFAAMSFTETAWRLNKEHLASAFLLRNNEVLHEDFIRITDSARNQLPVGRAEISAVIGAFDIAGLSDWSRRNWYPVNLDDLSTNLHKLNATREDFDSLRSKLGLLA